MLSAFLFCMLHNYTIMFTAAHLTFLWRYVKCYSVHILLLWNFKQKSLWRLLWWLNQITKRTQRVCLLLLLCAEQSLCPKIVRSFGCSQKAATVLSHSILLSNHKICGPSGKEQSAEQHCVAEENEFEYFLESTEEADKQGLHIQT